MDNLVLHHTDARQTPQWGKYMRSIGWIVEQANNVQILIRPIPLFKHAIIKIHLPQGTLPFDEIETIAKKHNSLFTLIQPHTRGYNEEDYAKNGYTKSKMKSAYTSTILIDLNKSEEEVWKSLSENARRNIKKAQKQNITVKHIEIKNETDTKYIDEFYKLYKLLGDSKKFYILPYDECVKKLEAFKDGSVISFAYVPENEEPIAAVWYTTINKSMQYVQTGITPLGYENFANYLLVWEGIRFGIQNKIEIFDFESIFDPRYKSENPKWAGFTEFKKRFHGEIVQYPPPWIKIYNLPYKVLYLCSTLLPFH